MKLLRRPLAVLALALVAVTGVAAGHVSHGSATAQPQALFCWRC